MVDPIVSATVIDDGVELAEKAVDLADQMIDLKAKYEQTKDEKALREIKLRLEKFNTIEKGIAIVFDAAKGTAVLIDTLMNNMEDYKQKRNTRKSEEEQREFDERKRVFEELKSLGLNPDPSVLMQYWDQWKKDPQEKPKVHGSKVKKGAYAECRIEMFGAQAGIVADEDTQDIVMLTKDNIRVCSLMDEKKRGIKGHTYYYYHIVFHDGQKCYARMRKKYKNAMLGSMLGIGDLPSDVLE